MSNPLFWGSYWIVLKEVFSEVNFFMRLFVVKLATADDFPDLYEEYRESTAEEFLYEHDFMNQIMFRTTGNGHSGYT